MYYISYFSRENCISDNLLRISLLHNSSKLMFLKPFVEEIVLKMIRLRYFK